MCSVLAIDMAVFNSEIWPPLIRKLAAGVGSVIGERVAWADDIDGLLVSWGVLLGTVRAMGAVAVPLGECFPEQRLVWCFPLHLWQRYLDVQGFPGSCNKSPIYTAENFWHGSDEKSTRTKKIGSVRIDLAV